MEWSFVPIVLWLLTALQLLIAVALLAEVNRVRRSLWERGLYQRDGLPVGTVAPEFSGIDLSTGLKVGSELAKTANLVVVFISPRCEVCRELVRSIRDAQVRPPANLIYICDGSPADCTQLSTRLATYSSMICDADGTIKERFKVRNSPTAVLVKAAGTVVATGHPGHVSHLQEMLKLAMLDHAEVGLGR